jgi:diguanylate cyclase (GGDEF)-like protein/PAS domain S-box-containing protein
VGIATGFVPTYVPQPEVHGLAVLMGLGVVFAVQLVASKVAAQQRSEAELRASEADFRQLFADNPQPMWVYDTETLAFLEVNAAAVRHYGFTEDGFLSRRVIDIGAGGDATVLTPAPDDGSEPRAHHAHERHTLKDGRVISVETSSHWFWFENRPAGLVAIQDVTQRDALEAELEHQAFHDSLTNLANRALFGDRVEHAIQRGLRGTGNAAVLVLDLDDFKTVNDSLGHRAGDELLVAVGRRIRSVLRPSDTAARLGGDEFAVLVEDLVHPETPGDVAARIIAALGPRFVIAGKEIDVHASVGIAITDAWSSDADELLRNADAAMYHAKSRGKSLYRVFEPSMHSEALARLELQADLRHALLRGEFVVHYQPVVSLSARAVVALEALVRWDHPRRGLLHPADFIPNAEETGLIVELGRWVLTQACQDARRWQSDNPDVELSLAVNVSARQLADPDLVDDVARILTETGFPARCLALEVTETIFIDDPDLAVERLTALKATGVGIAIDDFGTGYSSLGALQNLPVDTVKIDKAFIDRVTTGVEGDAVVQAILRLARTLQLVTVAEGVERPDQLRRLELLGCDRIQGYYFSHPLPADAVAPYLADRSQLQPVGGHVPQLD